MSDSSYPTMKLKMGDTSIFRTSVYTLEIKLDSWDKQTKEKFMDGEIFRDSEMRNHAQKVLRKHGLKEAYISSGWGAEYDGSPTSVKEERK